MSIIAYFGGKSSKPFQDFINPVIPKDGVEKYLEPFSGSFGTYMDGDLKFKEVYYNDKNRHQVNLVYCCSKPKEFLTHLDRFKNSILSTTETDPMRKWDFYKGIYHKFTKNTFLDDEDFEIGDFKRACMYAFLITSSFSSVYPRGGGFSGYNKAKDRLKLEVLIDKLRKDKYTDKLQSIKEFTNIDFEELIRKHDSDETYIYLDPPYYKYDEKTGGDDAKRLFWYGSDGENVFGPASHRRLLELIKTTKSRWSLSYYYFPLLEELLPRDKYIWLQKEVNRSSANGGNNHETKSKEQEKGIELLILNYDPETSKKLN
jgi:site-specific DNA-adenine methylase